MRLGMIAFLACISSFDSIIGYYLLVQIFLDKKNLNFWKKLCIIMTSLIVTALLTVNRKETYFSSIMFLTVVGLYSISTCAIIREKRIFACCYMWLYYSFLSLVDLLLAFFVMQIFKQKFVDNILMSGMLTIEIIMFAISRIIVACIVLYIIKQRWKIDEEFKSGLVIIDIVLVIFIMQYQKSMVEMALGESVMNALGQGFSLFIVLVMILLCMVLVMQNKLVLKEKDMLEMHDQMMSENYRILKNSMEKNAQFIHDMKHHLTLIYGYLEHKDWKGMADYIHEIEGCYQKVKKSTWTGNQFLDFLINQKKKKAENEGIDFIVETEVIPIWCLTDSEMSILFGNLLDNAIEACEKQKVHNKLIKINLKKRYDLQIITIQNSYNEKPKVRNNRLVTTKDNPEMHGYGIKGVEQIVEKYDGEFVWNISSDMFCVNVIFFNEGDEENE